MKRYAIYVESAHQQHGWIVLENFVKGKDRVVPTGPIKIGSHKEATLMNKKQAERFKNKDLKGWPVIKIQRRRNRSEKQN